MKSASLGVVVLIPLLFPGCSSTLYTTKAGYLKAGDEWAADGDPRGAVDYYTMAIDKRPNSIGAHVKRAKAWEALGREPLAEMDRAAARRLSDARLKRYPYADEDGDGFLSEEEDWKLDARLRRLEAKRNSNPYR